MHIWLVEKDFSPFQEGHIISLHQVNGKSKECAELNIRLEAYQCIIKTWKNHFELADSKKSHSEVTAKRRDSEDWKFENIWDVLQKTLHSGPILQSSMADLGKTSL